METCREYMMKPRPRILEPEEEEELGILEEVDAKFYGYDSVEEKKAHEQQMLEDIKRWEEEDERELNRAAYERWGREDLGVEEECGDWDDWDWEDRNASD